MKIGLIYCATNRVNGKRYIGKTTKTLEYRRQGHLSSTRYESEYSIVFVRALSKYGADSFVWSVMAKVEAARLDFFERLFIRAFRSKKPLGYNMTDGGEGGATITGRRRSKETKKKIGDAQRGRNKGKTFEEIHGAEKAAEIRAKCSKNRKGKPVSSKTRELLSAAMKRRATPEYCAALSARLMGHAVSKAARRKMSESQKKRLHPPHTAETKAKIGAGRRGKLHSEETKESIRAQFLGKTLEDRYGAERAAIIKAKQSESRKRWLTQQKKGGGANAIASSGDSSL